MRRGLVERKEMNVLAETWEWGVACALFVFVSELPGAGFDLEMKCGSGEGGASISAEEKLELRYEWTGKRREAALHWIAECDVC